MATDCEPDAVHAEPKEVEPEAVADDNSPYAQEVPPLTKLPAPTAVPDNPVTDEPIPTAVPSPPVTDDPEPIEVAPVVVDKYRPALYPIITPLFADVIYPPASTPITVFVLLTGARISAVTVPDEFSAAKTGFAANVFFTDAVTVPLNVDVTATEKLLVFVVGVNVNVTVVLVLIWPDDKPPIVAVTVPADLPVTVTTTV